MQTTYSARRLWEKRVGPVIYHLVALSVAALFLVMFVWVVSASLRKPGTPPPRTIEWIPNPVAWSNYGRIFDLLPLARYTLNSALVVALAVPLTLLTASWAGFAMALVGRRLRRNMIMLSIILLMVPITALWLTRFVLFTNLGLIDTIWALIAPALMGSSPFFILLFFWSFRRIPHELFEAALLDGASTLGMWRRVAMPLARPTIIGVSVLTFVMYWSDFINPLLYLKSESRYTLSMGLQVLRQLDRTNWPLLMAASVVMAAPVVILFLMVQRYFWPEGRLAGLGGR